MPVVEALNALMNPLESHGHRYVSAWETGVGPLADRCVASRYSSRLNRLSVLTDMPLLEISRPLPLSLFRQ